MSSSKVFPPYLVAEWHPTKNGNLSLENMAFTSHSKVWWLCDEGHEWEAQIANRTVGSKTGCPFCAGKKVLAGFNDLASQRPDIVEYWHPTKNIGLTPEMVTVRSGKKVWWLGSCGHEWERSIDRTTSKSVRCVFCEGKAVLTGFNDIGTTHPQISQEFHPTKNEGLSPQSLIAGSHKIVWWKCSRNHEWKTSVKHRCYSRSNCPYCAGQKVASGENDIGTTHPNLIKMFHPTLNEPLKVTDISYGRSSSKLYWQCPSNPLHYWLALAPDVARGQGCAICANQQILIGVNDLATTHPDIASLWHSIKNGDITPQNVTAGSNQVFWWLCKLGHESRTTVASRSSGSNCGSCTSYVSKAEQAIFDCVVSLGLQAEQSNRSILGKRRELDIYVPEKKVAIEFNGLYWHSESAGKDKSYHHDKWKDCKDKGIQLIQIWEDEWNRNPEQVKLMLAHKLGVSSQEKVFARKTVVAEVSNKDAETFLHANHIQGYASGSYYLGLRRKESDELVSLIVLKKEAGTNGKTLNIIRYATAANVVGGFTKLLSHAGKLYRPESFITFADHCVSDGGLYENNGFVADKELAPDYMYVVDGVRKHKFGYRLKRFQNDPNLEYVEGLSERELAAQNGLERVWDAGKTRYRKTL